jgi:hypothetical protein
MEGITSQVMLATIQCSTSHISKQWYSCVYILSHEYTLGSISTTPYYYIIPSNYIVGLFHGYGHIVFIIPFGTSLSTQYYHPYTHYKQLHGNLCMLFICTTCNYHNPYHCVNSACMTFFYNKIMSQWWAPCTIMN